MADLSLARETKITETLWNNFICREKWWKILACLEKLCAITMDTLRYAFPFILINFLEIWLFLAML